MKSYCLIIQMKATGQYIYFLVVLFIMTCKTFGPMNEILTVIIQIQTNLSTMATISPNFLAVVNRWPLWGGFR